MCARTARARGPKALKAGPVARMPARQASSRIAELERQLEEAKRKALEAETSGKAESSRRVLVSHRGHVLLTESDEAHQVGNERDKDLPHPHKVAWFKSSREAESVNVLAIEEPQQQQAVNIFETAEGGSGINVYRALAERARTHRQGQSWRCYRHRLEPAHDRSRVARADSLTGSRRARVGAQTWSASSHGPRTGCAPPRAS